MRELPDGLYESLLHEELQETLARNSELPSAFDKVEAEEEPARYAAFLTRVLEKALRLEPDRTKRLNICNLIIEHLAAAPDRESLGKQRLVAAEEPLLLEITPRHYSSHGMPR